jgi:hypothetical protein
LLICPLLPDLTAFFRISNDISAARISQLTLEIFCKRDCRNVLARPFQFVRTSRAGDDRNPPKSSTIGNSQPIVYNREFRFPARIGNGRPARLPRLDTYDVL